MGRNRTSGLVRCLPWVVLVTTLVVLAPGAVVYALASSGAVRGFVPLVAIGMAVSLAIAYGGRLVWQRTSGSQSLLFSDLMLWGWVRRYRSERRLDNALTLLGPEGDLAPLDPDARIDALKSLATSLESRDPYTHGHSRRVARYAAMIAERMGLSGVEVRKVRTAAAVHDVGKLEVPLEVLNKPGKLTDEEFDVIRSHAPLGAAMVDDLGDAELTEMVAHHHERLDGSGYPSKLAGEAIPLGARIIAVADTFDALTSTRAYRTAKRHKEALAIIHAEAGTQLDPLVVGAFDRCYAGSLGGLTVWALLAGLPHRLWSPLESQAHAATGAGLTKAVTIVAATAASGGIAASSMDPRDTYAMPDAQAARVAGPAHASGAEAASVRAHPGVGRAAGGAQAHREPDPKGARHPGSGAERHGAHGSPSPGEVLIDAPPAPAESAPLAPDPQVAPIEASPEGPAIEDPAADASERGNGQGGRPESPGKSGQAHAAHGGGPNSKAGGAKPAHPGHSGSGGPPSAFPSHSAHASGPPGGFGTPAIAAPPISASPHGRLPGSENAPGRPEKPGAVHPTHPTHPAGPRDPAAPKA